MAKQLTQKICYPGALVKGLPRGHPLGRDIRIYNEEPSWAKGPEVDIKEVAEIVLLLYVSAPGMWMRLWREVLPTVGSNRKITK
jgi:hypothetical protein